MPRFVLQRLRSVLDQRSALVLRRPGRCPRSAVASPLRVERVLHFQSPDARSEQSLQLQLVRLCLMLSQPVLGQLVSVLGETDLPEAQDLIPARSIPPALRRERHKCARSRTQFHLVVPDA